MVTLASSPLPYTPQPFHHGRLRGLGHPHLAAFFRHLLPLASVPDNADLVVYKRRPNLVCELHLPAELHLPWSRLVVKRFGWRGRHHYWCSPLKRSKAMRAYRTACHLLAHGLLTPLPLGAFEARHWGFVQDSVYVTEAITDYMTLRQYCATRPDGAAGLAEVIRLAADYARSMHDSGLWHADLTLSNFLLTGVPGQRRLLLVDLNRARRLPYMPLWLRALGLARMDWREWRLQFLTHYGSGHFAVRRLQWIVHLYGRWRRWRRRVLRVLNAPRQWTGLK
ncbi:MAG TPA: lipopolysaccharide kinase InaA family protein [Candidatus Tectomicrobia bacterium]